MTSVPFFSIVTPVFNPPINAFRECIASVSQQTCNDWEWILVDDGSNDPEVIQVLDFIEMNPQVTVIRRENNGGIVAASNDGFNAVRGEFIGLLDHDDLLTADALETVQKLLISITSTQTKTRSMKKVISLAILVSLDFRPSAFVDKTTAVTFRSYAPH